MQSSNAHSQWILTEVFKAGPSTPWDCLRHVMSVSQVTQRWRGVAISTPSIRAIIHIGFHSIGIWLKLMEVFLEWSCTKSLVIIFDRNLSDPIRHVSKPWSDLQVFHGWLPIYIGGVDLLLWGLLRKMYFLFCALFARYVRGVWSWSAGAWILLSRLCWNARIAPCFWMWCSKAEGTSFLLASNLISLCLDPSQPRTVDEYQVAVAEASNSTDLRSPDIVTLASGLLLHPCVHWRSRPTRTTVCYFIF